MLQVVDTPGFGDSEGRDNEFIVEMMDVLKNELGYTNLITLVIEGSTPRFGEPLYNMLRQMTSIFGNEWWDFMVVGVSKWSYDQEDIFYLNLSMILLAECFNFYRRRLKQGERRLLKTTHSASDTSVFR